MSITLYYRYEHISLHKEMSNGVVPQVLPTLVKFAVHVFIFHIFKHIFHQFHGFPCVLDLVIVSVLFSPIMCLDDI